MVAENRAGRIEGYAIVSEDGMLADAARIMPDSLKFEADQRFFEHALDAVDVVVHGRHSQERQQRSHLRHRLMLTRRVPAIAPHPSNAMALLWNPAGASFEEALLALGTPGAVVGVIGGPDVFALFLDRYDSFICRGRPVCVCPAAVRCFRKCPFGRPRKCSQPMASRPIHRRPLIRRRALRW